jgi:ElaB/YqjD/DUF883 family membrane-anchored ribosome-binding protein
VAAQTESSLPTFGLPNKLFIDKTNARFVPSRLPNAVNQNAIVLIFPCFCRDYLSRVEEESAMVFPASTSFSTQEFWLAIALTAIPGILGGVTYGASIFLKEIKAQRTDWPPSGNLSKLSFFAAQALSGMGGSLAALLVTLWANRFPEQFYEIKTWLTLVCTGFVAGYVANRLLPAIADSLYNRLKQLSDKADEAGVKAEETRQAVNQANERVSAAEQKTKQAVQLATEMVRARDYLAGKDFAQRSKTMAQIATLTELAESFPTNRTLNILLARLYDEAVGDRQNAIAVLTAFLEAKKKSGTDNDADMADGLWNLANYFEVEGQQRNDPALRTKAVETIQQSLQLVPAYYSDLMTDQDFAPLTNSEEGKAMLLAFKPQYDAWLQTQGKNKPQPPAQ